MNITLLQRLSRCVAIGLSLLLVLPAHAETITYQHDNNGNITQRGTTTYIYDALNRLISESGPAKTQSFTYDANGNRLSDGSGVYTYAPTSNRMLTRRGLPVTLDAAGNITADGTGRTYVYNQAGQIAQVKQSGILIASYYYNYRGLRTRKVTTASAPQGAQTVLYVYDQWGKIIAEVSGSGTPLRTYIWRDNTPVAQIEHQPSRKIFYFTVDHLNTPRSMMDETGKVVWRWESDAFGSTLPNEDPDGDGIKVTSNLRFAGQYSDQETGLHYNWHRYYDPTMGQYIQADPIGLAGGINLYSYVGGNPVSKIDPLGLRDVIVAVWTSRLLSGSVGHVFIGEMNGTSITSQFPSPRGIEGTNTTKTWNDTVAAEGRSADYVYQVYVPNDSAFDAAAAAARNAPRWYAFPDGNTTTDCSVAASNALQAGGVKGISDTASYWPNWLNQSLLQASWFGNQVSRLPSAPW